MLWFRHRLFVATSTDTVISAREFNPRLSSSRQKGVRLNCTDLHLNYSYTSSYLSADHFDPSIVHYKVQNDTMAAAAAENMTSQALRSVLQRVHQAAERAGRSPSRVNVVAVSKTKPVSMIRDAYDAGHRHFGENYVQELLDKAPELPDDIQWHFIGHLQSNKAKSLIAGVPNLYMVEGVDNSKVANFLDKATAGLERPPLKVLVQVNTSGEESKFGVEPSECMDLVKHVKFQCPNLQFSGLMTIGMPDYTSKPENFKTLLDCRALVCKELEIPEDDFELSMGMSGDFEQAIEMGSTNVRIGSTIFGPRDYSAKK